MVGVLLTDRGQHLKNTALGDARGKARRVAF